MIPLRTFPLGEGYEVQFGIASWSTETNNPEYSVKYSWPDSAVDPHAAEKFPCIPSLECSLWPLNPATWN